MSERKPIEADLAAVQGEGQKERADGSLGLYMPFDAPVYVRLYRVMSDTKEHNPKRRVFSQAVKARTLEIDCFTFGVKVFVRIGEDGTLKVITEDGDGREVLATYSKE